MSAQTAFQRGHDPLPRGKFDTSAAARPVFDKETFAGIGAEETAEGGGEIGEEDG